MKHVFLLALIAGCACLCGAQPVGSLNTPQTISTWAPYSSYPGISDFPYYNLRNYTRSYLPQAPTSNPAGIGFSTAQQNALPCVTLSQYVDGLGRPLQEVKRLGGEVGPKDFIQVHAYNNKGDEEYKYLPFSYLNSGRIGMLQNEPHSLLYDVFNTEYQGDYPFTKYVTDNSPLNRVVKILPPGHSWSGSDNGKSIDYTTNLTISPTDKIVKYSIANNGLADLPVNDGFYNSGELSGITELDADGKYKISYTDKSGKLIAVQTDNGTSNGATGQEHLEYNITCYVYDDMERLRFVISPQAYNEIWNPLPFMPNYPTNHNQGDINRLIADGLCYQYWYDAQGRMIEKKQPGKDAEYIVYDRKDRPVLTQDGNLRLQNKWAFTIYDALDRVLITGIYNDPYYYTRTDMAAHCVGGYYNPWEIFYYFNKLDLFDSYPGFITLCDKLVENHYDHYGYAPSGTQFTTAYNNRLTGTAPFAQLPYSASVLTRGLLTSDQVRVMDPANPATNSTTIYYDDQARPIQQYAGNILGGADITTNQYDFSGDLVSSVLHHTNTYTPADPETGTYPYRTAYIIKKYIKAYRYSGTIAGLEQDVNGAGFRSVYSLNFDRFNRVSNKSLSAADNIYTYNIQGWLTGINSQYLFNPGNSTYFHEKLFYDNGFYKSLYNGDISGCIWRGAGRGDAIRFYGYTYDKQDRLEHAEFGEKAAASDPDWSKSVNDFTVSAINYDMNGNLRHMSQRGPGPQGPVDMDILEYGYNPSSNQVSQVGDLGDASAIAPDFKNPASGNAGYGYDANGNVDRDLGKGIGLTPYNRITYSYLNRPEHIEIDGKGTIDYLYDARGARLRKTVFDQTTHASQVFDYCGPFVYQDSITQYIQHEEGRCRPIPGNIVNGRAIYQYDYFIKDHLDNVRTVINAVGYSVPSWLQYKSGLEVSMAQIESLVWDNLDEVRAGSPLSTGVDDTHAAELQGGPGGHSIGTSIMLRAMPGDRFTLNAESYYEAIGPVQSTPQDLASSLLTTLTGGTLMNNMHAFESGQSMMVLQNTVGNPQFASMLDVLTSQNTDPLLPASHLNYVFFDENFQVVPSLSAAIQCGPAPQQWNTIGTGTNQVTIDRPGYLLAYISNKAVSKVYYDRINLTFYKGEVLEENHYYPFGLTLNSQAAKPSEHNKLLLTTKELQDEHNLNWYDFGARMYDEQTGRWLQSDSLGEMAYDTSPYVYSADNPIVYVDKDGKFAHIVVGAIAGGLVSLTTSVIESGFGALGEGNTWKKAGLGALAGGITAAVPGAGGVIAGGLTNFANSLAGDAIDGKELNYGKAILSGTLGAIGVKGTQKWLRSSGFDKMRIDIKSLNQISAEPTMQRIYEQMLRTNVAPAAVSRMMDLMSVVGNLGVDQYFQDGQTRESPADRKKVNDGLMIHLNEFTVNGTKIDNAEFNRSTKKDQEEKLNKYGLD